MFTITSLSITQTNYCLDPGCSKCSTPNKHNACIKCQHSFLLINNSCEFIHCGSNCRYCLTTDKCYLCNQGFIEDPKSKGNCVISKGSQNRTNYIYYGIYSCFGMLISLICLSMCCKKWMEDVKERKIEEKEKIVKAKEERQKIAFEKAFDHERYDGESLKPVFDSR